MPVRRCEYWKLEKRFGRNFMLDHIIMLRVPSVRLSYAKKYSLET